MPFLTPAYPFDPALIEASLLDAARRDLPRRDLPSRDPGRPTPHIAFPAIDGTPIVLGGVLRSDSPFLDATPHEPFAREEQTLWPIAPRSPAPPTPHARPLDVIAPPAPDAPFDRAAVARACARAARGVERVEATVMTDDGVADHVGDVAAWLAGATLHELEALARADWTGDAAAEIAPDLADDDPEVADVLRHARRAESAVVVEIDGAAAMAWLTRHRPSIASALTDGLLDDDARDDDPDEGDAE